MPLFNPALRQYRKNITTVPLLALNIPITFDTPLPNNDYEVYFQANLNSALGAINKTPTGFTMLLGLSVAGTVTSYAVMNQMQ